MPSAPGEPLLQQRGQQHRLLVRQGVAGTVEDGERRPRVQLEQVGGGRVPHDRVPAARHDIVVDRVLGVVCLAPAEQALPVRLVLAEQELAGWSGWNRTSGRCSSSSVKSLNGRSA